HFVAGADVTREEEEAFSDDAPQLMQSQLVSAPPQAAFVSPFKDEPSIDPALKSFLDVLSGVDSFPRRASEPRDPRADFVTLLAEQLDILREQVGAMSALFFWVNNRKQQLVLECGALDDTAHMYLTKEKKFPIEYDAVSMVVTKKKPELHSLIAPQAEADLIPYYVEPIGIASFAAMPVIFGDGIVGVITVDSLEEECFNAETLRLLTTHSKLISGLIRSYIEKYDLLASARTLEAARKLYQIVSPDSSLRVLKDQRRSPEWILRALTEAASEIVDWEWLATVSFDDSRRAWAINSLQSKHTKPYLLPKTPVAVNESIVGRCLNTGRPSRMDNLGPSSVRFSLDEDIHSAIGHSFLAIPIRTTNKNYGVLAIEHSERNRFTDADVETLEHLARSAAAALEITALSDIVEERALTDLLTGVFNKRGLTLRLNEELARAMEFDEPLTLVIFEIDGAAEFMARFSQEDIDTIILGVTRLLRYGARPFDVISRIGEHTFAALLVRMSDEEGYLWSEKMRKMIVSEVIAIGKRSFSVTVSIGVAGARRDGTTEELIEGAELALERAKELGGNNVIVY
ncbi:MAG TPA: GAF domain-containing protein, partial [Candidatus Kapabacteria bacterium]|nr:GAF domain-containing protein [Candidatus Kapabacteria bacterium]